MVHAHVVTSGCSYCGAVGPQWAVREGAQSALLWCQSCFHVRVEDGEPLAPVPSMGAVIKSLDEDHGRLVGLLYGLQEAARLGDSGEQAKLGLRLLDDLRDHFAREETFLEDSGYPQVARHREQHEAMMRDIGDQVTGLARDPGPAVFAIKLSLLNHLVEDQHYKDYARRLQEEDALASLLGSPLAEPGHSGPQGDGLS